MTPSERDLLCTWAKPLHKFEVRYCRRREDFKSYDKFESFEAVGLGLHLFGKGLIPSAGEWYNVLYGPI